jgi:hypothetical protein
LKINLFWVFIFAVLILFTGALINYQGEKINYIIFSLIFNSLLLKGFYRNKFYFEAFFSSLLWLGFWFKFSIHTFFNNYAFAEAMGLFDFTSDAFDKAIQVSSLTGFAVLLSFLAAHYFFKGKSFLSLEKDIFKRADFFIKYRKQIYSCFIILVLLTTFINLYLGIYQRGSVPKYSPHFLVRGLVVWLLLTGFAVISSSLIFYEIKTRKNPKIAILLSLLEGFFVSISMLSRAFIINTVPQIWSALKQHESLQLLSKRSIVFIFSSFLFLFMASVISVNIVRVQYFAPPGVIYLENEIQKSAILSTLSMFIDRWVGIEGVMSVSSYPNLNWNTLQKVVNEKAQSSGTSYYDKEIGRSSYSKNDLTFQHHVTIPGIAAFLFLTGSYVFLFTCMILIGFAGIFMELAVKKLTVNPILSALFAQSVAYRFIHFGYLPKQSYMYFSAFAFSIFLIILVQKFLLKQQLDSK